MSQEMMEETLTIVNEEGLEQEMVILFTFTSDETEKNYVLYYDPQQPQGDVYVSSYTDEGLLFPIEDEEEWEMIQEVFNTFMSADEESDHDHDHEHPHDHDHDHKDCDCDPDDPDCDCHHEKVELN